MFRRTRTRAILKAIAAAGRTQKEIAEHSTINYHPVTLSNIIHNRYGAKLNPRKASAFAKLLGVPLKKITRWFGLRYNPSHLGDGGLEPPTSCL